MFEKRIHSPCLTLLAISLAVAVSGCSTTAMVKTAVVANTVQEEAHNQLLAMNIVRGWHRMPMHFTQVTAVRSAPYGLPFTPGGGVEFGLGGAATPLVTLKPNLSSTLQNIDVAVLNSQEFMQGMTRQVDPSLMLYFIEQGWPKLMVLHLFLHAIEIHKEDEGKETLESRFRNSPDIGAPGADHDFTYFDFRELVWALSRCEIRQDTKPMATYFSAPFAYDELKDLGDVAAAKEAGLTPIPVQSAKPASAPAKAASGGESGKVQFGVVKQDVLPKLVNALKEIRPQGTGDGKPTEAAVDCANVPVPRNSLQVERYIRAPFVATKERDVASALRDMLAPFRPRTGDGKARVMRFVLRSPEAMIYYLGELARAADRGHPQCQLSHYVGTHLESPPCVKLFDMPLARKAERAVANAAFTTEYGGETYVVEKWEWTNRSVQTLSMLTQILSLQNKGQGPPTTATVRVLQ